MELFINPQTKLLRSGWRAGLFVALLNAPRLVLNLFLTPGPAKSMAAFDVSVETILAEVLLVVWVVAVSWFCLSFLERLKLPALGFAPHSGWLRDVFKGLLVSALMVALVVTLQVAGGGTRLSFNSAWRQGQGIDWAGAWTVGSGIFAALVLLILAGAFEELLFRGYAFQTLLRGAPAFLPILLFSVFFGLAHLGNPNRTFLSATNTVLAGVWLSVAYLRTRSLWFPTALHTGWNWMQGAFFGLPVSGLRVPEHPVLASTNGEPVWLTGGSYGSEGGMAATVVFLVAIVVVARARWLSVSPEMEAALIAGAAPRQAASF
jgi:membrane protease YdiL (CAAX protease family)